MIKVRRLFITSSEVINIEINSLCQNKLSSQYYTKPALGNKEADFQNF